MSSIIPKGIPFTQIPDEAIEDGNLTAAAFRVLAYLFRRANSAARTWPSHRTIARDIGINKSTVASAIDQLKHEGWITVHVEDDQHITGHRQRHSYTVFGTRPERLFDRTDKPTGRMNQTGTVRIEDTDRTDEPYITTPIELQPSNNNQLRPVDHLWDSFTEIHGQPASKTERGKYNKAVKLLREADVEPDEYAGLVAAYAQKYDQLQPSVMTVATRVGEMRHYRDRGAIKVPTREEADFARRVAALEAKYGDDGMERIDL